MRCLDRLGANLVIQADANAGPWTGPDGDMIEQWQPLSWMIATWRTVADPGVSFAYSVTPMLTGAGSRTTTWRPRWSRTCRSRPIRSGGDVGRPEVE
jgi:hypothetical protein